MGKLDPKFVLKEASSNKETLIYLVMWSNYKRMKIYIGEKLNLAFGILCLNGQQQTKVS